MSNYNESFARQHNLSAESVNEFAKLGRRYAEQRTHALNGDDRDSITRSKSDNAKLWKIDSDRTASRMTRIAKSWGFNYLNFGVGLYPTIQRDESDTHGTIRFNYDNPKTFTCDFTGRKVGAIGIRYHIVDSIDMPADSTLQEVRLKLYDKYEHISNLTINGKDA